jgi:hypothetical protein
MVIPTRSPFENSFTVGVLFSLYSLLYTNYIAERGYGKVDKQRIPLTDNEIIEEQLGKYGYDYLWACNVWHLLIYV